jgi:hypothetical protein
MRCARNQHPPLAGLFLMSPTEAEDYARQVFILPEAAPLLMLVFDPNREREDRERALVALDVLRPGTNPRLELPPVPVPAGMAGAAAAVGAMLCAVIYSASPLERQRAVKLLSALCTEAGAMARGRAA